MEELPKSFEVVVVGTGVAESIVAAACSRVGKEVLHLDANSYYGGAWSSFNWASLQEWVAEVTVVGDSSENGGSKDEGTDLNISSRRIHHHVSQDWYIPEDIDVEHGGDAGAAAAATSEDAAVAETGDVGPVNEDRPPAEAAPLTRAWSKRRIEESGRRFSVELAPKVIYSSGSLVALLIQSNVSRYLEFKCVTRILTKKDGEIVVVPCSRADVFATRGVSVVEKRMLMKIMNFVSEVEKEPEKLREHDGKSFVEFLRGQGLTDNLVHFVVHSIAMVDADEATVTDGVNAMQRFLDSLGRFGNSPFLWPMFGSGEIPQAFCRLCAVFGGTYFLNRGIQSIGVGTADGCDVNVVEAVVSDGARIECKNVVVESRYLPDPIAAESTKKSVSRAILLTDRSLKPSSAQEVTLFRIPKKDGDGAHPAVVLLELSPGSGAVPEGIFLVHLTCPLVKSPEEDLLCVIDELFRYNGQITDGTDAAEAKPSILWRLTFACDDYVIEEESIGKRCSGLHVLQGPGESIDFECHVQSAKKVFEKMFPDEEFLPRAPDPDEIVIGDDDEAAEASGQETAIEGVADSADSVQSVPNNQ